MRVRVVPTICDEFNPAMSITVAHEGSVAIVVALTAIVSVDGVSVDGMLAFSTGGGFRASVSVVLAEPPPTSYCSSAGEGVAGRTVSPTATLVTGEASVGLFFRYINLSYAENGISMCPVEEISV